MYFSHDYSILNISRSDSNYIGSNTAYQEPVFLNGCHQRSNHSWQSFKCYGHCILHGTTKSMHFNATIYATSDIPAYDEKHAYDVKLSGNATENTTDGKLTKDSTLPC